MSTQRNFEQIFYFLIMKKTFLYCSSCVVALILTTTTCIKAYPPSNATTSNTDALDMTKEPTPNLDSGTTATHKDIWTSSQVPQKELDYPSIGKVTLYGNSIKPAAVALFLSGDGGWNSGVIDMAKAMAQDGKTLVVGIDIIKYYKKLQKTSEQCLYPAGDLENLSEFVQKELQLPDYHKPILVGYSSGATLTYGLLCQAPINTFKGGIIMGFCPDIQLNKPLCEGSGKLTMNKMPKDQGFMFNAGVVPGAPLEVLHGEIDKDCNCETTSVFFKNVKNVKVQLLPKVGHGFSVTSNWMPQFRQACDDIISTSATTANLGKQNQSQLGAMDNMNVLSDTKGLPLNITTAVADTSEPLVFFLSGDGGWTGFDQKICDQLAAKHVPSIGLNCQSYFWEKKTPETTVNDLAPIIKQYLTAWGKTKFVLVGYSFGANITPFLFNRLPSELKGKSGKMVLLSADTHGDFEIHIAGMLGQTTGPYDVVAEIRSLQNTSVLCVSGEQEDDELKTALQGAKHVWFEKIPGSHHYNNDAAKVAATILMHK
jgi:type IV secretory pathway VirJ component